MEEEVVEKKLLDVLDQGLDHQLDIVKINRRALEVEGGIIQSVYGETFVVVTCDLGAVVPEREELGERGRGAVMQIALNYIPEVGEKGVCLVRWSFRNRGVQVGRFDIGRGPTNMLG